MPVGPERSDNCIAICRAMGRPLPDSALLAHSRWNATAFRRTRSHPRLWSSPQRRAGGAFAALVKVLSDGEKGHPSGVRWRYGGVPSQRRRSHENAPMTKLKRRKEPTRARASFGRSARTTRPLTRELTEP